MKLGKYIMNNLMSLDQLGNSLLGGDPDETISSRIGKLKVKHGGDIPWSLPITKITDWILDKIDPNHSIDAIEGDEGKDAIINKARRKMR